MALDRGRGIYPTAKHAHASSQRGRRGEESGREHGKLRTTSLSQGRKERAREQSYVFIWNIKASALICLPSPWSAGEDSCCPRVPWNEDRDRLPRRLLLLLFTPAPALHFFLHNGHWSVRAGLCCELRFTEMVAIWPSRAVWPNSKVFEFRFKWKSYDLIIWLIDQLTEMYLKIFRNTRHILVI